MKPVLAVILMVTLIALVIHESDGTPEDATPVAGAEPNVPALVANTEGEIAKETPLEGDIGAMSVGGGIIRNPPKPNLSSKKGSSIG